MKIVDWAREINTISEPTLVPVVIEPSSDGSDDIAQLLSIATFNGFCRVVTALADRKLLCVDELRGIEEAMTTPLDDAEWRDDPVISALRDKAAEVAARAVAKISDAI